MRTYTERGTESLYVMHLSLRGVGVGQCQQKALSLHSVTHTKEPKRHEWARERKNVWNVFPHNYHTLSSAVQSWSRTLVDVYNDQFGQLLRSILSLQMIGMMIKNCENKNQVVINQIYALRCKNILYVSHLSLQRKMSPVTTNLVFSFDTWKGTQ